MQGRLDTECFLCERPSILALCKKCRQRPNLRCHLVNRFFGTVLPNLERLARIPQPASFRNKWTLSERKIIRFGQKMLKKVIPEATLERRRREKKEKKKRRAQHRRIIEAAVSHGMV